MVYPEIVPSYGTVHVKNVVRRITLRGIPVGPDSVLVVGPFINHLGLPAFLQREEREGFPTAPAGARRAPWFGITVYDPLLMTAAVTFQYE